MVQSVERAFAILDAVAKRPAGVTALADRLDLPKSTVARLLGSLEELGAVERLDGKRWQVGPSVEAFARTVPPERRLAPLARPALVELVRSLGEDAGLGLPDGYDVLYVDQVECDHPVQVRDWTGTRAPMHAVPSGLVLMADWPEDAVDAYVARGLAALTPRTVVDPDQLRARLEEVRARACVGAPGVRGGHRLGRGSDPRRERKCRRSDPRPRPRVPLPAQGEEEGVALEVVDAAAAISGG